MSARTSRFEPSCLFSFRKREKVSCQKRKKGKIALLEKERKGRWRKSWRRRIFFKINIHKRKILQLEIEILIIEMLIFFVYNII